MASIAINGLGRAGRAALKILDQAPGAEVVAVDDLISPDDLACLLRYDTVYGRWHTTITADGDLKKHLTAGARRVILWVPARAETVVTVVHGVNRAAMTRVMDGILVKVMSWYHNERGFTCQMIRQAFTALGLPAPDLSQIRP